MGLINWAFAFSVWGTIFVLVVLIGIALYQFVCDWIQDDVTERDNPIVRIIMCNVLGYQYCPQELKHYRYSKTESNKVGDDTELFNSGGGAVMLLICTVFFTPWIMFVVLHFWLVSLPIGLGIFGLFGTRSVVRIKKRLNKLEKETKNV